MITGSELHCLASGAMTTTDPATIREIATYALQALDGERDRALGAAVRAAITGERWDTPDHLDWIAKALERDGYIIPLNVIRAIATHLRGERA